MVILYLTYLILKISKMLLLKKYVDNLIAENVGEGNISDIGSPFFKENDNFKATYAIDMVFKKLLNLSTPSEPSDAATKRYVDNIESILNESINSLSQLYNTLDKTQEEINEKIDNALCDAPEPLNHKDVATKEYADKISSLLNAIIIKLSQLYITLSRTVEEYKEKINKTQEEINKRIDDTTIKFIRENEYLSRIRENEKKK